MIDIIDQCFVTIPIDLTFALILDNFHVTTISHK